ncbi:GGDEF-domain containing protein, partial [Actinoplanes sp. NPDC024001]
MDAARPRMPGFRTAPEAVRTGSELTGPRHRRTVLITTTVAVAGALTLWAADPGSFAGLPPAFWTMAVLAIVVDARPYLVPGRRASAVILPSICFTFAILLAWGGPPAMAVQLVAVTVAGVRIRHSLRRTLHLALQHAVALGAAAVVAGLASLRFGPTPGWRDAALTVAAAAAWIAGR